MLSGVSRRAVSSIVAREGESRLRSNCWSANYRGWMPIGSLAVCSVLTLLVLGLGVATAFVNRSGITWSPCPEATGYLCGSLKVPIDYGHPFRGSLPLAVIEHPVPDSKGVIVFNPGPHTEMG